ncbi:NAD(P)/FAD-dependent oxidoreductase (plasmid) [Aquamicrobium terrae]
MREVSPLYARPSGWNRLLPPRPAASGRLSDIRKARFVVIGAGYAGIAASRRLAELFPDEQVVLLESSTVGEGAAGRNSGFLIDLPYAKIQASKDAREAEWQKLFLQTGRKWLEELVLRHGIDCGWNPCGNYKSAMTEQGEAELKELAAQLTAVGASFQTLSRTDLESQLGTAFYRSAVWMPNCILVQPAALVRGLADSLPRNIVLAEETVVAEVRRGRPHTVITGQGEIKADTVIFANNSFLSRFGIARSRQITMYTYAGLTPALPADEAAGLGRMSDWGMVPAERMGATTRKVGGNRYMIRTGFSYERELDNAGVETMLTDAYRARYPDMRSHELEYVWAGAVSITRNGAPFFGAVGTDLYGVSGCNGSGIIKMSLLGKLLAEHIAGQDSALLRGCLEWARPSWIPPEPLRRIGVALATRKHVREVAKPRPHG